MYALIDITRAGSAIRITSPQRRRSCEWLREGLKRRPLTHFFTMDQRAVKHVSHVNHY